MRALRVEIQAKFSQSAGTIIDADDSFRIKLSNQRVMVELPDRTYELADVPLGVWLHFSFSHDGFTNFGWGFDSWVLPDGSGGAAGGGGVIPGHVQGVGAKGILIGNRIGAPSQHLSGDIALLKVWRQNPSTMSDGFLERPLTPAVANCWAEFFRKLKDAVRKDPKCGYWLAAFVKRYQTDLLSGVAQLGQEKAAEFQQMGRDYAELWRTGKIGSPEMIALAQKMRDWLKDNGLLSLDDPDLLNELANPCLKTLIELLPTLDCDPQFQALIRAIFDKESTGAKTN
jgi:hypothetical protein